MENLTQKNESIKQIVMERLLELMWFFGWILALKLLLI